MTMCPKYSEHLPSYLDGANIRKHAGMIESVDLALHSNIDLLGLSFDLERPILFGGNNVVVHTRAPIRKVTLRQGGTVEFVSYDYDALVTDATFRVSDFQSLSSFDYCRVETYDDVTYEKSRTEHDPFLDNLGRLCGVPRKSGETDLQHQGRVRYFCEHYGEMDLALLMLYVLYGVTESRVYSSSGDMNRLVVRDWGVTDYDEVKKFSDKYCPITRPLLVVPPIQLDSFTSTTFTFKDYYPISEVENWEMTFFNINKNKTEDLSYTSGRTFSIDTTGVLDGTSYPVSSYVTNNKSFPTYLLCFKAYSSSVIMKQEYYGITALGKFQEAEAYRVMGEQLPDSWFNSEFTTVITVSASSSTVTVGGTVTLTVNVLDGLGEAVTTGGVILHEGSTVIDSAYVTGEAITFTVTPTPGTHTYTLEYFDEPSGSHFDSETTITIVCNKQASSIATNVDTVELNIGDSTSITGTLLIAGTGTSGETVKLLDYGGTILDTTTTTSGGAFSFTYTPSTTSASGHSISVSYEGTSTVSSATKDIGVTINKQTSSISTTSDSLTLYYGSTGTITGTYKVENTGSSGATIKLKAGNTVLDTATTGTGGAFSFTYTANDWSLSGTNLTLLVEETSLVASATKNIALTLQRHTTTLSVADVTASVGDTVDIVVYATDENGDPVSEGTVTVEITQQSNNS